MPPPCVSPCIRKDKISAQGSSDKCHSSDSILALDPNLSDHVHQQRLQRIANVVPGLGPSSRVIDVGSGTGCLIPHLRARGVQDILAVDLSEAMLAELERRHAPLPGSLGNNLGENLWMSYALQLIHGESSPWIHGLTSRCAPHPVPPSLSNPPLDSNIMTSV
jgi:SAM-dependent methyltransferase